MTGTLCVVKREGGAASSRGWVKRANLVKKIGATKVVMCDQE